MRYEKYIIVIVFIGFIVIELWTLLPKVNIISLFKTVDDKGHIAPFFFSKTKIHYTTYIWMICLNIFTMILFHGLWHYADRAQVFFGACFIMQALYFTEFFFTYNEALWHFVGIPINITILRFWILFCCLAYTFATWKD